jgi:hypothetical protein
LQCFDIQLITSLHFQNDGKINNFLLLVLLTHSNWSNLALF